MMSSNIRIAIIFGLFFCQLNESILFSQTDDFINGNVINSDTKNPVPFATIRLQNNKLGVYANADGDFRISRNPEFRDDSLIVTCIGYTQISCAIKDLQDNIVNKILLSPIIYGLNEAKVYASRKKIHSLVLIRKAIRYISTNYPYKPYNYISYYRDYQKKENGYINLNEAIVQTLDNGFNSKSVTNKYRLLDFRKNADFPIMDISPYYSSYDSTDRKNRNKTIPDATLGDQYGNELFILMVHDAIRNFNVGSFSFVDIFSSGFISNHLFSEPVNVFNNNLLLYRIDFTGRQNITRDLLVSGSIYIQPDDYSIHKLEYKCYYKNEAGVKKPMFNIDIEYGYENSIGLPMCLKYISFNNYFKVANFTDTSSFKVTEAHFDKNSAVLIFNNQVDPVSASKKKNYEVTVGKIRMKINNIQVAGKRLSIYLEDNNLVGDHDVCAVKIKRIKDVNGNFFSKRRSVELYQYRELFVQEYNSPLNVSDTCYMQYLPLDQNCISVYKGKEKYWMNTPVNVKITDK